MFPQETMSLNEETSMFPMQTTQQYQIIETGMYTHISEGCFIHTTESFAVYEHFTKEKITGQEMRVGLTERH